MTIMDSILDCIGHTPVVALRRLFPDPRVEVLAKLEFLNPGGSVKDRAARHIVTQGLEAGAIKPTSHLVESSSGNFGIALAMVCRIYGLPLTVVVDPDITPANEALLRQFGATVDMVTERDEGGTHLHRRLQRVAELTERLPEAVWINQYANDLNWRAHLATGEEILQQVDGPVDYLVAAVSTSGTIRGVAHALRRQHPALRVVAVDAVGSVIFGGRPQPRRIPGIGASRVPELLRPGQIDQVIQVSDEEAISGCRTLLSREGIFAGGSSGSVVSAIGRLPIVPPAGRPARVVTLLPDRGERYLGLVYDSQDAASPPHAARRVQEVPL